jgi:hypothetical protein
MHTCIHTHACAHTFNISADCPTTNTISMQGHTCVHGIQACTRNQLETFQQSHGEKEGVSRGEIHLLRVLQSTVAVCQHRTCAWEMGGMCLSEFFVHMSPAHCPLQHPCTQTQAHCFLKLMTEMQKGDHGKHVFCKKVIMVSSHYLLGSTLLLQNTKDTPGEKRIIFITHSQHN